MVKIINHKKGQVWVETLIYTMITFALISAVLAFVNPKIQELQDKAAIDSSIEILKQIDNTISEIIVGGQGNQRKIKIMIKKGDLKINSKADTIMFEIQSPLKYSEQGIEVKKDGIIIITNKTRQEGLNNIQLKLDYKERYNITFGGKDILRVLSKDSSYYELFISNNGDKINFNLYRE